MAEKYKLENEYYMRAKEKLKHVTRVDKNSWLLQSNPDSYCEACFVTITPDRNIVMTGDYDGVIVRPNTTSKLDLVRWMNGATTLGYFGEKCVHGNRYHEQKEYSEKRAEENIKEIFENHFTDLGSEDEEIKEMVYGMFDQGIVYPDCEKELKELIAKKSDVSVEDVDKEEFKELIGFIEAYQIGSIEHEHAYYELIFAIEGACDIYDLVEYEPREYTSQLQWQHGILLFWAEHAFKDLVKDEEENDDG